MSWYEKLKFARRVLGLSQRAVARKTGISDAYLCEIEKGRIKDPSFFKILTLLKLYNLNADEMDP